MDFAFLFKKTSGDWFGFVVCSTFCVVILGSEVESENPFDSLIEREIRLLET